MYLGLADAPASWYNEGKNIFTNWQNWYESPQNRRECLLSPYAKSDIIALE